MARPISIARAAGAVSLATGISRVLGLAREMTIASLFARSATDAFFTAFRIPNLLRDLLAEGALSAAFIPTYAETLERRGREHAFRLASSVINAVLVMTGLFALSVVLFARVYAFLLASGFAEESLDLTAALARVMSPFLITMSVAAVLMGMANASGRFFVPALAPALFNVGVLAGGWVIAPWMELMGWPRVTGLAIGAVLGGLCQLAVQVPGVRREGYSYQLVLAWRDPAFRQVMTRMAPAVIGVAATYVNVVVDNQLASYYGAGPVSYLFYAFRLWMLPIGLFGVAISTANLAGVARDAARGDRERFRATLATSVRLTLLLTVPAAAALATLGTPIVRVIFQHGKFTIEMTEATAFVLAMYAVGLPAYALIKVFVPTFYALGDPWTPVRIAATVVLLKVALSLVFAWPGRPLIPDGYPGLALATGLAACVNAAWTGRRLVEKSGSLRGHGIVRTILVTVLATAAMIAATQAVGRVTGTMGAECRLLPAIAGLALQVVVGMAVVGLAVAAAGLPESDRLRAVLARLGGRKTGP
ncbi:MAG: murein biosynthesis integral membrane protein MurJ [Acidobacteriota bacterium]|nr:murein biosynthesis integral membrane protein MurJ [Acidobacteriota bacterium]